MSTRFLDRCSENDVCQTDDYSQVEEHLSPEASKGQTSIHVYSALAGETTAASHFNKSAPFPLPDSTPAFIRAGWDSCSDLSDS